MNFRMACAVVVLLVTAAGQAQSPQTTNNPFPRTITATDGVIAVRFVEFAVLPDIAGEAQPARMMLLIDEPGTGRLTLSHGKLTRILDFSTVTITDSAVED